MTALDAVIAAVALLALVDFWAIIALRRRTNQVESQTRFLRARLTRLEQDIDTLWVSPNHQLPPHIKHLDIQRPGA